MGGICSKSSHLTGGHTLGPAPPIDNSRGRPQQQQQQQQQFQHRGPRQHPPPQTAQTEDARRSQAAAAAERRMKAVRLVFFCPFTSSLPLPSCPELVTLTSLLKCSPANTKRNTSEGSMPPILIQDGSPPNWKHQSLHLLRQNRAGGKTPLS